MQTQDILKKMKKRGLIFERMLPTSDLEVIADLTEAGCGIGILPGNIAASHQIASLPKTPTYHDEICLLYHGQHQDVQAFKVITEAIKQGFAKIAKS